MRKFSYKLYCSAGDSTPVAELDSSRLRIRVSGRGSSHNREVALWSIELDGQLVSAGEGVDYLNALAHVARLLVWISLNVECAAEMADAIWMRAEPEEARPVMTTTAVSA